MSRSRSDQVAIVAKRLAEVDLETDRFINVIDGTKSPTIRFVILQTKWSGMPVWMLVAD